MENRLIINFGPWSFLKGWWATLGLGVRLTTLLRPFYVELQLWFWKHSHIFFHSFIPLWAFFLFPLFFFCQLWFLLAYFFDLALVEKLFWDQLCRLSILDFKKQSYLFIFHPVLFGAFCWPSGLFLGLGVRLK